MTNQFAKFAAIIFWGLLAGITQAVAQTAPAQPDQAPKMRDGKMDRGHLLKRADANQDGSISASEADAFPMLKNQFKELDKNSDGQLTQEELARVQHPKGMGAEKMQSRFRAADKNGDGSLNKEEFAELAPNKAARFTELDTNGDGQVTPAELHAARAQHDHRRPAAPIAPTAQPRN